MWWLWIREKVRRYMKPINEPTAKKWDRRIGITYMGIAWTFVGLAIFSVFSQNPSFKSSERPGTYYAKLLQKDNVTVMRIRNFSVVDTFDYNGLEARKAEKRKKDAEFYGESYDEELLKE